MKIEQRKWTTGGGWQQLSSFPADTVPSLVFVFGGRDVLKNEDRFQEIKAWYPSAHLLFCSTAGEIISTQVLDDSLAVTAIHFSTTTLKTASIDIDDVSQSKDRGVTLAQQLPQENLKHVLVFSDGLKVNGTALVEGLTANLPPDVSVTGGLVADGSRFQETLVGLDAMPSSGKIVLIGLYGDNLRVSYGSFGGWDVFGPDRVITKSENNVLYELDGQPALELYKKYLGDLAKDLPSSGLLFPLSLAMKTAEGDAEVVRTVLAVDESTQSLTFAGDMPQGVSARLMKANFERLIDGASEAAGISMKKLNSNAVEFALLISCVGRKLVLKERIEEEVEAVSQHLGAQVPVTGFYSYGEICPTAATEKQCQLHNQTMTITTFGEEYAA